MKGGGEGWGWKDGLLRASARWLRAGAAGAAAGGASAAHNVRADAPARVRAAREQPLALVVVLRSAREKPPDHGVPDPRRGLVELRAQRVAEGAAGRRAPRGEPHGALCCERLVGRAARELRELGAHPLEDTEARAH